METQVCTWCEQEKPVTEFNWKNKSKNLYHSHCKTCHAEYRRQHYLANREKYIAKAKCWNEAHMHQRRAKAREYIYNHLLTHPCVDCGETDPIVLEFDHVRGQKVANVSELIRSDVNLKQVIAEIAKCDVRCANCHKRKTARQVESWVLQLQEEKQKR